MSNLLFVIISLQIARMECKEGLETVIDGVRDWMNLNEDKLKQLSRKFVPPSSNFRGRQTHDV